MKQRFTLSLFSLAVCLSLPGLAQQPATAPSAQDTPVGQTYTKKVPDDLPQSKLLFIKHSPVPLPAERPKGMLNRRMYAMQERHNEAIVTANEQLVEAAARYPYAHRITTLDSVAYYRAQGYKYMLMHTSFNAGANGTFQGTRVHGGGANATYTSTNVDLFVQDLATNDRYIFDHFSETFLYYYKGQVGMLVKKVDKQFKPKKS